MTIKPSLSTLMKWIEQFVGAVNADSEVAKLRTSMSHITRKPGESIQTPLYRLKTLYEMLIQINFPDLDIEKIKIRADNYACNCAKFLITSNTAKILTEYIRIKQQRDEHLNLMKLCNVITSHEAGTAEIAYSRYLVCRFRQLDWMHQYRRLATWKNC